MRSPTFLISLEMIDAHKVAARRGLACGSASKPPRVVERIRWVLCGPEGMGGSSVTVLAKMPST
jgi:hypothetical protein